MDALNRALASAKDGNLHEALAALLEAWRASPAAALADVIDLVSEKVAAREPPIRASGGRSAKQVWYDTLEAKRPAALPRLLEALPDCNDFALRLAQLEKHPKDPRIAAAFTRWLKAPPVKGARRRNFYSHGADLLKRTGDVRARDVLQAMTRPEARAETVRIAGLSNWTKLRAVAEHLAAASAREPKPEAAAMLAGIREALGGARKPSVDPAQLFAEVWAHPEDDAARAVLADALQERGDPRGEFIALQLARHASGGARTAREKQLQDTWGREWLGSIEPYVLQGEVEFERGFVARCRLKSGFGAANAGSEWTTVTHLDCSWASRYVGGSRALLGCGKLASLRHVTGLGREDVEWLVKSGPWPWRTLGLRLWQWTDGAALAASGPKALPELTRLELRAAINAIEGITPEGTADLVARFPAAEQVAVDTRRESAAAMLGTLSTNRIKRLTVETRWVRYEREGSELKVVPKRLREEIAAEIANVIDKVKGLGITALRLVPEGRVVREGNVLEHGTYRQMGLTLISSSAEDAGMKLAVEV